MSKRFFLTLLAAMLWLAPASAAAGPAGQSTDLLAARNGNFETEDLSRYPPVAPENVAWWNIWTVVDNCKPSDNSLNYACTPNGFYKESLPNGAAFIHSGGGAVTIRNNWDPWEAGLKQTLDAPAGAHVRLTAYAHLWTAQVGWNDTYPHPPSDTAVGAICKVGLDPDGTDYPTANSHVVWSDPVTPHDTWKPASVEATVGPSGKVTVILYTSYRGYSRNFMTASWDDATLLVVTDTPSAPQLKLNYSDGQPGSSFLLTGTNFQPSSTVTLTVNAHPVSDTVPVDSLGGFNVALSTAGADPGVYLAAAADFTTTLTARFVLTTTAPLRAAAGSYPTFTVPAGLGGVLKELYLPAVTR